MNISPQNCFSNIYLANICVESTIITSLQRSAELLVAEAGPSTAAASVAPARRRRHGHRWMLLLLFLDEVRLLLLLMLPVGPTRTRSARL